MKKHTQLLLPLMALFCLNLLYAQPNLNPHQIELGGLNFPGKGEVIDVDNDGLLDIVMGTNAGSNSYGVAANQTTHIAWYKNLGNGEYEKHPVKAPFARDVVTTDVDNDGDLDFIYNAKLSGPGDQKDYGELFWLENMGSEQFERHFLYTTQNDALNPGGGLLESLKVVDMNNDGYPDIIQGFNRNEYRNDEPTDVIEFFHRLFLNDQNGDFENSRIVNRDVDDDFIDFPLEVADIDGDNDLDIVYASESFNSAGVILRWKENDGQANFTTNTFADFHIPALRKLILDDIDEDGDIDVMSFSGPLTLPDGTMTGGEYYFENDGSGNFSPILHTYDLPDHKPNIDFDNDGDLDYVPAANFDYSGNAYWEENTDTYNFSEELIDSALLGTYVSLVDLEEDGDWDFIVSHTSTTKEVYLWINDGNQNYEKKLLDSSDYWPRSIVEVDLDQDGDIDLVSTEFVNNEVNWYENDGNQNFTKHNFENDFDGARDVAIADINQDGFMDIVAIGIFAEEIGWWQNDGNQNFSRQSIAIDFDIPLALVIVDFDGDNVPDILSCANNDNEISLWENEGTGFFSKRILDTSDDPIALASDDMNGDGSADVVAIYEDGILLLANDGNGDFNRQIVSSSTPNLGTIELVDLDQDGDLDILSTSVRFDGELIWWTNDGIGSFTPTTLSDNGYINAIATGDLDADGDIDIFMGDWDYGETGLRYFENDGNNSFTETMYDPTFTFSRNLIITDLDLDGDLDLVGTSVGNGIRWWENSPIINQTFLEVDCPADITLSTTTNTAIATWFDPVTIGDCPDPAITFNQTQGNPSGSDFPIGVTTITYEISDPCGNTETCSFNIIVEGMMPPGNCPDMIAGYTFLGELNEHNYFISNSPKNWEDAQLAALNSGGYLAAIGDQEENDFIQNQISEILFIGYNDAQSEGNFSWANLEATSFENLEASNSDFNDFANINFWNGGWGLDNKYVVRNYLLEIDCNDFSTCTIQSTVDFIRCDDGGTVADETDDSFSFEILVEGFGMSTFWTTMVNGEAFTGDYGVVTDLGPFPLFAPGETITLTIEDADGGCVTYQTIDVPRPCPGTMACPIDLDGYDFLGQFDGHHYFISQASSTWENANIAAQNSGAYLAAVNDASENDFLQGVLSEMAFIGLSDLASEGQLEWSNGEGITYENYSNCNYCISNSTGDDFVNMNFWDGYWSFDNHWVQRKHILEMECESTNNSQAIVQGKKANSSRIESLRVYPNPVEENLFLKINCKENRGDLIQIFDARGSLVYSENLTLLQGENQMVLSLPDLASGFYFLSLKGSEDIIKFVKVGKE